MKTIQLYLNEVKWVGTILCLLGILLTSFNIYPLNIFLSFIGSFLWTCTGLVQNDKPLFVVEVVATIMYLIGIFSWGLKLL